MKLYIDSRKAYSGTPSNFVYQLPESIDLPESMAYIDVVLVPNVFYTIREGFNDRVFLKEVKPSIPIYIMQELYRIAVVAPGNYNGFTLATAIQTALNANTILSGYVVTFDTPTSKLKFDCNLGTNESFHIYPTVWMRNNANVWSAASGITLDASNLMDAGSACGLTANAIISSPGPVYGDASVNTLSHHTLFIHSNLGDMSHSIGPNGESDIIRRICIESPQNEITVDRHSSPHDSVKMLRQSLRNIHFRLTDVNNDEVDLQGHNYSFSVIIHEIL